MKRNRIISIAVLLATIAVIVGIYIIRNAEKQASGINNPAALTDSASIGGEEAASYTLHAKSLDLTNLQKDGLPILIDFGSTTCGPCITMAPYLETIHEENKGKAIVQFVDVEKYPDITKEFPIVVIPTQILINADGSPYVPSEDLGIEFVTYNSKETGEHIFTVHQGLLTVEQMQTILKDMGVKP